MKRLNVIFLVAAMAVTVAAQEHMSVKPTWGVEFNSVFDNREGDNDVVPTKTFFFTQLAPEVGLQFSPDSRIAGGVVWTQPLGADVEEGKVTPTIYYRFESPEWKFSMGMFPRHQLTEELPRFLWNDSLSYYDRNIRGAMVQYSHRNGWAEAFIDWTGMQTRSSREHFKIVVQGKWHPGRKKFFAGMHLMMNHYAKRLDAPETEHIVDNFLLDPYAGIELSHPAFLDSLVVKAGFAATVERNRGNDFGWRTPCGGWLQLMGQWRWLRVENLLYAGGKLFPSYAEFGADLYPGEPFLQRDFYNRTDIYLSLISRSHVNLEAALDFNFTPGKMVFYQRLMLRVSI